jgi:hypothetical protein
MLCQVHIFTATDQIKKSNLTEMRWLIFTQHIQKRIVITSIPVQLEQSSAASHHAFFADIKNFVIVMKRFKRFDER